MPHCNCIGLPKQVSKVIGSSLRRWTDSDSRATIPLSGKASPRKIKAYITNVKMLLSKEFAGSSLSRGVGGFKQSNTSSARLTSLTIQAAHKKVASFREDRAFGLEVLLQVARRPYPAECQSCNKKGLNHSEIVWQQSAPLAPDCCPSSERENCKWLCCLI